MADYRALAIKAAEERGIDPNLFLALIQQESGFNPKAKSPVGAYGLTQVMPDTAKDPGWGIAPLTDMDDTDDQIRFGADYLSEMLKRYDGDTSKALAAYNWGAGNADKWSGDLSALPEETRGYIRNITGNAGLEGGPKISKYSGLPPRIAADGSINRTPGILPEERGREERAPSFMRDEYADNWLGRLEQKGDTMRAGLGDKLGIDARQMEGIGGGLQGLGQYMMRGGFG